MSGETLKDLTDTADTSWIQLKIRRTIACVTTGSVDTVSTDAGGGIQTLINIYSQKKKKWAELPSIPRGMTSPMAVAASSGFLTRTNQFLHYA